MLADPYFEPIILVCPYILYGEERMWQDMKECYDYFEEKKYPLLSSYNKEENRWIKLEELNPDIVFFTNPHKLTKEEYYEDAYMNYLSCYAGYGIAISKYQGYQDQYNQVFHNAVWKIFVQTTEMLENYTKISARKDTGVELVGDCIVEVLRINTIQNKVWKNKRNKTKIIFAPHHTIEDDKIFSIGTFLLNANFIIEMVKKYKDETHWSFKPHPLLKSKLYTHQDWGKEKTDVYYKFWETFENTQIDDGEYIDLFKGSDAIILDSSAFLGEYLFMNKPILYLLKKDSHNYFNTFGNECLEVSNKSKNIADIESFIQSLLNGKDNYAIKRKNLINKYDKELKDNNLPSEKILNIIKTSLM